VVSASTAVVARGTKKGAGTSRNRRMTMSKHTKGPWLLVRESDEGYWRVMGTTPNGLEGCYAVAEVIDGNSFPENTANANLIAASPDLKEALERYVALDVQADKDEGVSIRCDSGLHRAAVAALKKATGGEA
jgi:hypothetical protein